MPFIDRVDAGRRLGQALAPWAGQDVVVVGLPRGGVPVAAEVARALGAPLDVVLVRKLGLPSQPELAMGAIGEGGVRILNDEVVRAGRVTREQLDEVEAREREELDRRASRYRRGRPRLPLAGRVAIVVDDGIATGSTARAACQAVRLLGAQRVVLAVPLAPFDAMGDLRRIADEVVCVETPTRLRSVGEWYRDFSQTTDDQVIGLLDRASETSATPELGPAPTDREVDVTVGGVQLPGHLTVPPDAIGVVIFAHGSGSSRHSPRNHQVARFLNTAGVGTLLFDLLTPREESDRANVFDIDLLGGRLAGATRWLRSVAGMGERPIGYFGASTGAGAALWAAAEPDLDIAAVVSRGGRPDLAAARLPHVKVPTLLIVGGRDDLVIELNRRAARQMHCERRIAVVPLATHLFAEPGALDAVATLARNWFVQHFGPVATGRQGTVAAR